MGKWRLRDCPRCGGDMFIDSDIDGWHAKCLQCSYRNELKTIVGTKEKADQTNKERSNAHEIKFLSS